MDLAFDKQDQRRLATGAAVAVAAGVLIGAAMKPDFGNDRVLGPQYFTPGAELRQASYAPDPGLAAYRGKVPDYVFGTDWTRPRHETAYAAAPQRDPAADEPLTFTAQDEPQPPVMTIRRTWREPAGEPSSYPSVDGFAPDRAGWRDEGRYGPPRYDRGRDEADEPADDEDAPAG